MPNHTGMDPDDFRSTTKRRKPGWVDVAQQDVFAQSEPPSVPVDTSEDAADAVRRKSTTAELLVLILRTINSESAGLTDAELQDRLNLSGDVERARRWTLHQNELIRRDVTVKRVYQDRAGKVHKPARPWLATVKGDRCLNGLEPYPWAAKRR